MAKTQVWGGIARAAFDACLVLLGALVAHMNPLVLVFTTVGVFGVAVGLGIFNRQLQSATDFEKEWAKAYRDFRTNLTTLTAHIRTALLTVGTSVAWDDVARKARWPDLGDQPLKGWPVRKASWMTNDEQTLLDVARRVESVERNTIQFQTARSLLSDALDQWLEWSSEDAIAATIQRRIAEHRDAIVMLVYLEIAHADAMTKTSPAPNWRHLPTAYPVLLA